MTNDPEREKLIREAIEGLHRMFHEWDRQVWQHFVDGSIPTAPMIIGEIPAPVREHPDFEDCMPGDEGGRLDVASGAYEAVRKVRSTDWVLDVGAHVGHFTRRALTAGASVMAIEPDPRNFRMLSRLLLEFPYQLNAYPVAAGAAPAEMVKLRRSYFSTQHRIVANERWLDDQAPPPVKVPKLPLDLLLVLASFIKIDVEGSELVTLQGLNDSIKCYHPFIVAEVFEDIEACADLLRGHGYSIQASTQMHLPPEPMTTPIVGLWHCTHKEDRFA